MLKKYKHIKDALKVNKNEIPKTVFTFDQVEEFNEIYHYCLEKYIEVPCTNSGGISNDKKYMFFERFMVNVSYQQFELLVVCSEGCYRFILKSGKSKDNNIKGARAVRDIYQFASKYGLLDHLKGLSIKNGEQIKNEINSPHIAFMLHPNRYGKAIKHCYHLDLNSAYASEIIKIYPEFTEMFKEIYAKRHDDDGYYKHVLTNSIGCFQSKYCPDIDSKNFHKSYPYQFANLSKIAINGTRETIERKIEELKDFGAIPILTNTDGIWYYSPIGAYHDNDEGTGLGQWKTDADDVILLVKSKGAYQYLDQDGICHTVVRGKTNLDAVLNREDWEFGAIMNNDMAIEKWGFIKGKGVVKVWQNE